MSRSTWRQPTSGRSPSALSANGRPADKIAVAASPGWWRSYRLAYDIGRNAVAGSRPRFCAGLGEPLVRWVRVQCRRSLTRPATRAADLHLALVPEEGILMRKRLPLFGALAVLATAAVALQPAVAGAGAFRPAALSGPTPIPAFTNTPLIS